MKVLKYEDVLQDEIMKDYTPQEYANTFNKVVSVDTKLYYPHTFDYAKERIMNEVWKNVKELKDVFNEENSDITRVLNYEFVLGKYYGAMWIVKEVLGYDLFYDVAMQTKIVKELEKQGNELVERVIYGKDNQVKLMYGGRRYE